MVTCLRSLNTLLTPIMVALPRKTHTRRMFEFISKTCKGNKPLVHQLQIFRKLWTERFGEFFIPVNIELVFREGDSNPWHQDMYSGWEVYRMKGQGLRVMFDLGVRKNCTTPRSFKIHNGEEGEKGLQTTFLDNAIIGMNGAAAGSGGKGGGSKFLHARFGDGITLVVGMAPKQAAGHKGLGNKPPNMKQVKVQDFFRSGVGITAGTSGGVKPKGMHKK